MNENILKELKGLGKQEYAVRLQKYFKTGKGEYGEGDRFLGIQVPVLRKISKKHQKISIAEVSELVKSQFHEVRLFSLFVLVEIFKRANDKDKKIIYNVYLSNTKFINNWDLVDSSAGHIVGAYLLIRDKKPIYMLAKSKNLWERRFLVHSETFTISNRTLKLNQ